MYISSPSTIIILQVRIGNPQLKRLLHRFILIQNATLGGRKPPYLGYVYIVRLFSFSWGPSHCEGLSRSPDLEAGSVGDVAERVRCIQTAG